MAVGLPCPGLALAAACLLLGSLAQEECVGETCAAAEFDATGLLQSLRTEKSVKSHVPHAKPRGCDASLPLVTSPGEFQKCWENHQWCCVDESAMLFGSVMAPHFSDPADPTKDKNATSHDTMYPGYRSYAWFGGSQDLEASLGLRSLYGESEYTTFGIQVQVGFNPLHTTFGDAKENSGYGFQWLVFQVKDELKSAVFVPTFAQWLLQFEREAHVSFSNEVADEILKAYNTLRPDNQRVVCNVGGVG